MTARVGRFPLLRLVPDTTSAGRAWRDDAACVGVDPEAFYPADMAQADIVEPVRRVCHGCPVRAECLAEVMATEEPTRRWGVIAGTTPSERRLLHRAGLTVTAHRAARPLRGVPHPATRAPRPAPTSLHRSPRPTRPGPTHHRAPPERRPAMNTATLILTAAGAGAGLWLLHKLGQVLTRVLEAAAAIVVVFLSIWFAVKGAYKAGRWLVRHWRTTLTAAGVLAWCHWLGWPSLTVTAGVIGLGLGSWRLASVTSFDVWAGRHLRSWWQRWAVYAPRMPGWLRACRLTIPDDGHQVVVMVNPLRRRSAVAPRSKPRPDQVPQILGVRSGPSWDEVRVRLVPGQTPEDVDDAARALAVARGVPRCQVRELEPNVVSIDFQRRNLLADVVACGALHEVAGSDGATIDLSRVWSGRTEYGTDWHQPLAGGHTLVAGSTGAGKNSVMWAPIVSIAPAIRAGLVRVNGIDPKGMELAYGRRLFHRYAVTSKDTLAMLDELVEGMEERKREHAGRVRTVPITTENPLELVEFDEIGALVRYVGDRKTREAITERIALLTTQGRALGYTVRGYVQEPTKDTVPVRELFPRRICLRVASKSHVGMVLGEHAYDRGAWANRIGESEPGVGYLFGEGVREPLRVRAGWVPDQTIKDLEDYVTGHRLTVPGTVHTLPIPGPVPAGGVA